MDTKSSKKEKEGQKENLGYKTIILGGCNYAHV
jgi:hypothetical protein